MADTLIAGTTLVEKESRSSGDVPVGGTIQWAKDLSGGVNTFPDNFIEANGQAITDPLSQYNGSNAPNLNTKYVTIGAAAFTTSSADVDNMAMTIPKYTVTAGTVSIVANIQIPNGAIVTGATIFGSFNESWVLTRVTVADGTEAVMATAAQGVEDTTISDATIDNSLYAYIFSVTDIDAAEFVYGANIKYESPKDQIWLIRIK
tara:strand:- start:229 stop:840 length:612 start_codon:yes stop_codon:yes gene_type:complete